VLHAPADSDLFEGGETEAGGIGPGRRSFEYEAFLAGQADEQEERGVSERKERRDQIERGAERSSISGRAEFLQE